MVLTIQFIPQLQLLQENLMANCSLCQHFYNTDIGTCDACQSINDDYVLFAPLDQETIEMIKEIEQLQQTDLERCIEAYEATLVF